VRDTGSSLYPRNPMRPHRKFIPVCWLGLAASLCLLPALPAQDAAVETLTQPARPRREGERTRRAQRVVPFKDVQVASPNGQVVFTLFGNAERLTFKVTLGGTTVIEPSPLAFELDGYDLSAGVVVGKIEESNIDETYPWLGAVSTAHNRCHVTRIELTHDLSSTPYVLEVRAFDDGVAYRHIVAGDEKAVRVPDERSAFILPTGSTVWIGGMEGHYETEYVKKDLAAVSAGEWAGPPLTAKLPGGAGYASITEANLVNYAGMGLESDGRRGWMVGLAHRQPLNYPFELRYGRDEGKRLGKAAAITGTITTPWRVVMIGRDLNALVTSTILPNLCPPADPTLFPAGVKTDWVRPGRAAWVYVDGRVADFAGYKEFSRQAGAIGFEHHVIEGVWNRWTMEQRKEIADDSRARGVDLYFWKHSRDLRTPEAREAFFKMLHEVGAAGAKIDFFDHDAKEVVDVYEALLQDAAKYHLSLIFHGCNKPTGRARTWPNEMVREAVRGMEASRLADRARHQSTLPFTRCLAGPADYTSMIFNQRRGDTTAVNQIASMAIFSAPLLTVTASPQHIIENPAVDVIKAIPAVWDETIVLPGSEIGELAAFARRVGKTWFVAVMNGPDARTLRIPLSFLGESAYRVTTVRDTGSDGLGENVEHAIAHRDDTVALDLGKGGGFVARYEPQP
jgi:alpha-glucosidase